MRSFFKLPNLSVFFFLLFIAFIYLKNLSSDVYGGDSGDLISAAYLLGVPHPPGYPLYTMFGFLLTRLPITTTPAYKVGLISVFAALGSIYILYKFSYRVSKSILISLLSSSILSFSYLFWFYSEIAEVFVLNVFFGFLLFYLAFLFYTKKRIRYLYAFAFFSGLSLTHHHTILFIFPAFLILITKHIVFILKKKTQIAVLVFLFFLGLLPYFYIPIAASHKPLINWLYGSNLHNFLDIILRRPYGTFKASVATASSSFERLYFLKYYALKTLASITIPAFIICLFGMFKVYKNNKRLFIFLLTGFLFSGVVFNFYSGFYIAYEYLLATAERFYILSSALILFFLPFGLVFLKELFAKIWPKFSSNLILLPFFIIPIMLFKLNFTRTNFTNFHGGENLGKDILSFVPQKGVLVLQGDTNTFSTWYARYVLGYRTDIDLINPPMIVNNKIYSVGNNYYFEKESSELLKNNKKVSRDNLLSEVIVFIHKKRRIFAISTEEISSSEYIWIPRGMGFELINQKDIPPKENYINEIDNFIKQINFPPKQFETRLMVSDIQTLYLNSMLQKADFLYTNYNDSDDAILFLKKILELKKFAPAFAQLGIIQLEAKKDCKNAKENIMQAITINPALKTYYLYLYDLYKRCNYAKDAKKTLKKRYKDLFIFDIDEEVKSIEQNNKDVTS